MMSFEDLAGLEKFVRRIMEARWKTLAILRTRRQSAWLRGMIRDLYQSTRLEEVASLDRESAVNMLETLKVLERQMDIITESVPFDRKLSPWLRGFTPTFQRMIQLRNATHCGVAALKLRLEGGKPAELDRPHLSAADILDARERMLYFAPSWIEKEMEIYDHL